MKVYIKSKFNPIVNQLIPHNINFANAMYGFLEMGADVELYENWKDIKDKLTKEDIVVDYIDRVVYFLNMFGEYKDFDNYPKELEEYLHRKIWKDTINSFSSNPDKFTKGYFIKPIKEKVFTGHIVNSTKDLIACGSCYEDYEIFVSEPLNIYKEWRVFILYDKIIGIKPYRGEVFDLQEGRMHEYGLSEDIADCLQEFKTIKDRPNACSLDFGMCYPKIEDKTQLPFPVLIETNDCIALGSYGLNSIDYAKMISARQSQVLNRKDEFKF